MEFRCLPPTTTHASFLDARHERTENSYSKNTNNLRSGCRSETRCETVLLNPCLSRRFLGVAEPVRLHESSTCTIMPFSKPRITQLFQPAERDLKNELNWAVTEAKNIKKRSPNSMSGLHSPISRALTSRNIQKTKSSKNLEKI